MPLLLNERARLDISAASGLVLHGGMLHVIADDGLTLHRYTPQGMPLATLALFPDDPPLPEPHAARKKHKPDLEALTLLADHSLLALGSGSTPNRMRGSLLASADTQARTINLQPLYQALGREFPTLNIEGAALWQDFLVLAQRGNGRDGVNAIVLLTHATVQQQLARGFLSAECLHRIVPVVPGRLGGVPLSITDLAVHPDGMLYFTAAAEDTDNTYDDGACAGSVIGRFDENLSVVWREELAPLHKIEGLGFQRTQDGSDHWLLVADNDNPAERAPLLELQLPAYERSRAL